MSHGEDPALDVLVLRGVPKHMFEERSATPLLSRKIRSSEPRCRLWPRIVYNDNGCPDLPTVRMSSHYLRPRGPKRHKKCTARSRKRPLENHARTYSSSNLGIPSPSELWIAEYRARHNPHFPISHSMSSRSHRSPRLSPTRRMCHTHYSPSCLRVRNLLRCGSFTDGLRWA